MGGRQRAAERRGQRREEVAARLHHRGRLRHHAEVPRIPAAADRGRGLPAVQERSAGIRQDQGCRGEEEVEHGFQALVSLAGELQGREWCHCSAVPGGPVVPVRSGLACLMALFLSACGDKGASGDKLPLLPPDSSFSYTSPPAFTVTIPISPIVPTHNVSLTNFTIIPNLPAGLVLDPATGVISGTPTQASATTTYTVSVPDGTVAVTATLVLTVNPLPLNIGYRPASDSLPMAACGSPDICYDPHANPFTQLEQAKVRARTEKKLILVVAG